MSCAAHAERMAARLDAELASMSWAARQEEIRWRSQLSEKQLENLVFDDWLSEKEGNVSFWGRSALKSQAAMRREQQAKDAFTAHRQQCTHFDLLTKTTTQLLAPSCHLTTACYPSFRQFVAESPGWRARRRVATAAEKAAHGETRKAKCYFIDVIFTPPKKPRRQQSAAAAASSLGAERGERVQGTAAAGAAGAAGMKRDAVATTVQVSKKAKVAAPKAAAAAAAVAGGRDLDYCECVIRLEQLARSKGCNQDLDSLLDAIEWMWANKHYNRVEWALARRLGPCVEMTAPQKKRHAVIEAAIRAQYAYAELGASSDDE